MKPYQTIFLILIFSVTGMQISGQDSFPMTDVAAIESFNPGHTNGIDFFETDTPMEMTLHFDMWKFLKTKNKPEYLDATLIVKTSETDSVSQHILVKARGEFRRSYCSFPPIMLKFKNHEGESEPIMKKGSLKLVTHCNRYAQSERYVLKEYLAYKLFNLVTPYSFKTRLVKINYIDINNHETAFTTYAFLIENENDLAARNNAVVVKSKNITQKNMNTLDMARMAVFNFLIGNTDWSVPMQHNVKVIKPMDHSVEKGIPVAYDFDYSGLVNTVYAAPNSELPIKSVTERYYMGLCFDEKELKPIVDEFLDKQEQLIGTINDFDYLSKNNKKQAESYINSFYRKYKSEDMLISDLNRSCKRF